MQNGAEQKLCDSGDSDSSGGVKKKTRGSFWSGTRVDVGSIAPVGSSEIC